MTSRLIAALALLTLAGCGSGTLAEVGREPALSPVGSGITNSTQSGYDYPATPVSKPVHKYSLWNDRQSRLFTDPRALSQGDILTVKIEINDRAKFKNESDRSRTAARSLDLGMSGDWNGLTGKVSGKGNVGSSTTTNGAGATSRSENIVLSVAAVVTQVMPNGNLLISGSQEVRVNAEMRILTIAGIVRPTDIGPENTVPYERIAEARISYGGRGRITEVQQPPYGQQIVDQVLPF